MPLAWQNMVVQQRAEGDERPGHIVRRKLPVDSGRAARPTRPYYRFLSPK